MRQFLHTLTALLIAGLCSAKAPPPNTSPFEPAQVVSAADVSYPLQSIAVGTVVVELTLSDKGEVEDVRPIREIQSLTETAVESARKWKFKPALLNGQPTRSRTVVAVTFNPSASLPQTYLLPSFLRQSLHLVRCRNRIPSTLWLQVFLSIPSAA